MTPLPGRMAKNNMTEMSTLKMYILLLNNVDTKTTVQQHVIYKEKNSVKVPNRKQPYGRVTMSETGHSF